MSNKLIGEDVCIKLHFLTAGQNTTTYPSILKAIWLQFVGQNRRHLPHGAFISYQRIRLVQALVSMVEDVVNGFAKVLHG